MTLGSRRLSWAALALALCAVAFENASARCARGPEYTQSLAVKNRYPDPPATFDTPAFAAGNPGYTTYAQMMSYLEALGSRTDSMLLRIYGYSQERRALPALVFTDAGRYAPAELRRLGRPIVFLTGQLHGNEPAGGEAMLALAQALAEGELKPLLSRITVVIVPRANPDGAHYFWRGTANCTDIDRDHLKLDLPETMALRRLIVALTPDVFVESHESGVASPWLHKFNAIQAYDFTMAHATHHSVHPALTRMAENIFGRSVAHDAERAGYSRHWYYTTGYNLSDKRIAGGSTLPDVGRNYAGLDNALSFLVTTRGVGIGRESYARRVHTQYVVLASLLTTAAKHAHSVREVTRSAREDIVRRGADPAPGDRVTITLKVPSRPHPIDMLDPSTGEIKTVEADWLDPREALPALTRSRPYAYLLLPSQSEIVRRFMISGFALRRLTQAVELEVERYEVIERRQSAVFVEGHLRSTVATEVLTGKRLFPAGTYVYAMAQPAANLLVAALEPESSSSFVSLGIVPTDIRGLADPEQGAPSELPIYRLVARKALKTEPPMPEAATSRPSSP